MPPDDSDDADTIHLSDAELHDVVVLTTAVNEAEALYLMNRLEDSGIPVLRTADAVNYHNPIKNPEIRVPRVLVARAQEIVDVARQEAKARALENAFDVDEVDEKDARKDPLIREMARLATLPHDQKLPELALYIIEWFAAGRSSADIARYLSLAGLTPDEARALVADVYENQQERLREKREANATLGPLLTAAGALLLVLGYLSVSSGYKGLMGVGEGSGILLFVRLAGIVLVIVGVSKLATSKAPSRLEEPMPAKPPEPAQPSDPEKSTK